MALTCRFLGDNLDKGAACFALMVWGRSVLEAAGVEAVPSSVDTTLRADY